MCNSAQYFWQFSNKYGFFSGYLDAVDTRDAVSRIMTQTVARSSQLFGHEYDVPLEVIDAAPGNAGCLVYRTVQPDYSIRVERLA
jgi:hypothetical protein